MCRDFLKYLFEKNTYFKTTVSFTFEGTHGNVTETDVSSGGVYLYFLHGSPGGYWNKQITEDVQQCFDFAFHTFSGSFQEHVFWYGETILWTQNQIT